MSVIRTACPFCGCGCDVGLIVEHGQLVGSSPVAERAGAKASLCARGWHAHEAPAWGRRLEAPLVRRDGRLEAVGWDEAVSTAARALVEAHRRGERVAALGSARATNEENYLLVRLVRGALASPDVDVGGRESYWPLVEAAWQADEGPPLIGPDTVESCRVIVVVEGDLAVTHPRLASSVLRAVEGGARLITTGWVRTQMSRLAALHVAAGPGAAAEFARMVRDSVGKPGTALRGEGDASGGESATAARQVAEWVLASERSCVLLAPTGSGAACDAEAARSFAELARSVRLNVGRECRLGVLSPRGNLLGAVAAGAAPNLLPGLASGNDQGARARLRAAWREDAELARGECVDRWLGRVAGLVVLAGDPLTSVTAARRSPAAGGLAGNLVVLDAFETETSLAADVVLPIAAPGESEGTWVNLAGTEKTLRQASSPPGRARQGWEALVDLSAACGGRIAAQSLSEIQREIEGVARLGELTEMRRAAGESAATTPAGAATKPGVASEAFPLILAFAAASGWEDDTLVRSSPTLDRDGASHRKLYPRGWVEISRTDAGAAGIRAGWPVRLVGEWGEVTLPAVVRDDLAARTVQLPWAARGALGDLVPWQRPPAVRVERA